MLIDFLKHDPEDKTPFQFDVCIVGCGAAGISAALEFNHSRQHNVCVIESGAVLQDPVTQSLYAGDNIGFPHTDLDSCRLRFIGGSTNCWNGWCFPLNPHDFEKKDWIPGSGWPVTYDDILPYYHRAQKTCRLDNFQYDSTTWQYLGMPAPDFNPQLVQTEFYQTCQHLRFGHEYLYSLESSDNITLIRNANAIHIEVNDNATSASSLSIRNLKQVEHTIRAKHFILATGGIETPRLLLASNNKLSNGIGNRHDQVGRYFMEHPYALSGMAIISDQHSMAAQQILMKNNISYTPVASTGLDTMRSHAVPGSTALFESEYDKSENFYPVDRQLEPPPGSRKFYITSQSEQVPNPSSRVLLSRKIDALGQRRAMLDWKLTSQDRRAVIIMMEQLAREFIRTGSGQIKLARSFIDPDNYSGFGAGNHHMGTTRMGNNPLSSVVDRNATVHGFKNLHIAGSAVFTTGGYANPTFTIIALSIRLADRVKTLLQQA